MTRTQPGSIDHHDQHELFVLEPRDGRDLLFVGKGEEVVGGEVGIGGMGALNLCFNSSNVEVGVGAGAGTAKVSSRNREPRMVTPAATRAHTTHVNTEMDKPIISAVKREPSLSRG